MEKPAEEALPGTHSKVLELLEGEKIGRILDAPSGQGALSIKLKEKNFVVVAIDLNDKKFIPQDIEFKKVDLNAPLPFEDEFFEHIICVEGIEHIENPHFLIKEFSRVLKKNGVLILTTPNTLNIYNRIRFFLFGSRDVIQDIIDKRKELYGENIDILLHHPSPIDFPYLKRILDSNNLNLEKITCNRSIISNPSQRLYIKPLFSLLLILCSVIIYISAKIFSLPPKSRMLLKYPLLWGENLILKARKK
jgi:SAM-dependent methyltransferase